MSGRLASTPHTTRRTTRTLSVAAFAVLCGLVSGLLVAGVGISAAEEPKQPNSKNDPTKAAKPLDAKNPLDADGRKIQTLAKFAIPNPDRAIFGAITDGKAVANQIENENEYFAWYEFVTHANQFTAAELEQAGFRGLTVIDLLQDSRKPKDPKNPNRWSFRLELIRFDGKLVCIRRLEVPTVFTDNPNNKVKELYEARFVPLDDSPRNPVSFVFLDLPKEFAAVKDKPVKEWLDVDSWISASGFYFKTMNVPGDQGNLVGVPVLVGKSITPLPGLPVPPGDDPTVIDQNVLVYKSIRDETKMVRADSPEELAAWNRVLMHAHRFTAEELEKHARDDIKFGDLFEPVRVDFRLKNVKFEGRLISLRKMEIRENPELLAAKVETVYEGWLIPRDEPRGNPIIIVFTQPLEGVEPGTGRVNKWVSFAGYSFKKVLYESAEPDPKHPGKFLNKYAPLVIGKGPIARRDPDGPSEFTWTIFMQAAVLGGVLLIAAGGCLAWWYRGGDRKAKESMAAVRERNPFDPNTAPPTM